MPIGFHQSPGVIDSIRSDGVPLWAFVEERLEGVEDFVGVAVVGLEGEGDNDEGVDGEIVMLAPDNWGSGDGVDGSRGNGDGGHRNRRSRVRSLMVVVEEMHFDE